MIVSFANKETKLIFLGYYLKKFSRDLQRDALKQLTVLHSASILEDLRIPWSNHLEKLLGDRDGQYSIRINKQFRLCFRFTDGNAYDVEMVDYHK